MSQPRPKPSAPRASSASGIKALIGVTAIGLTIGGWSALSADQRYKVLPDASPLITHPSPAPRLAGDSAPIPTLVPLVVPAALNQPRPIVAGSAHQARLPTAQPTVEPLPSLAPALRTVNPPPPLSVPKPISRTRSSR